MSDRLVYAMLGDRLAGRALLIHKMPGLSCVNPAGAIVLNPQLRVVLLHEIFDRLAALGGLHAVGVEVRDLFCT
jgi:hypothetical protein